MHNFRSYTIYKAIFSPTYGTAHAASILAEQLSLNIASEKIQNSTSPFPLPGKFNIIFPTAISSSRARPFTEVSFLL